MPLLQDLTKYLFTSSSTKRKKPVIYISGIAGFLGGRIAHAFDAHGYTVAGVDNFSTGYRENLPARVAANTKSVLRQDLSRRTSIEPIKRHIEQVRSAGSEEVLFVHTAAPAYDANSFLFASLVNQGVVLGTVHALLAAAGAGVARFCNLSSMARYERVSLDLTRQKIGYEEDDSIGGATPYGEAKVAAERQVRIICDRLGMPWVNLVFHNVIGVGQQYNNPLRNVASIMLNLALHGKAPCIYGTGEQRRSFTDWEAVEENVVELIVNPCFAGLTLNVGPGPGESVTLNQLAELVYTVSNQLTGRRMTALTYPFRRIPTDGLTASLQTAVCSDRRWRMLFGEAVTTDYEKVLTRMAEVMLKKPKEFD